MPDYHYSYFIGTMIFVAAWVVCYWLGKSYRPQMIWGTLVSMPFALTSLLFIPQYWQPPSLFNLDAKFHVGIEDFLWAGAVGGIASILGEYILKERLVVARASGRRIHYAPFVVVGVLFLILQLWHPQKTIYNMVISFAVGAIVVAFMRPDLIRLMLTGAMNFTLLYLLLFVYFLALYPDFVQRYYTLQNFLGIFIFRVPIEELMFASTGGAIWSVAYEYLQGYRLASAAGVHIARIQGA
jgi:hypothetical protein